MSFKDKWNFSHLSPRRLLITGTTITLMIAVTFVTLVAAAKWEVTITDNGNTYTVKTTKPTVGEVLCEKGITLEEYDVVFPSSDKPISEARQISVKRAFDITISDIDGTRKLKTACDTIGEALSQNGILLDEDDETIPPVTEKTAPGMQISVIRVEISELTEKKEIGYDIIEEQNSKLAKGTRKLVTSGKNGLANITYRVTTKNGIETDKEEISREVLREPVNKVVSVGTKQVAVPAANLSSRGSTFGTQTASRVLICRATAYDASYETLGRKNPKTALGRTPTVGTVAVDPSVIPLGTRLYIETVDGSYVYGECFAGDTGSSIRGNRVDLFMESRAQALRFGERQVRVYVLD